MMEHGTWEAIEAGCVCDICWGRYSMPDKDRPAEDRAIQSGRALAPKHGLQHKALLGCGCIQCRGKQKAAVNARSKLVGMSDIEAPIVLRQKKRRRR